jgi:hypothetical protein
VALTRWILKGYPTALRRPITDLWVGGPKADGRGLPAVCGGVGPAQATIVSPSADPGPSGQFRFLQRTHHNTWSPSTPIFQGKLAGDLLATGRRRWTGSAWSYFDAGGAPLGTVDWRGPLPGSFGPSTNITDTVRRGVTDSGFTPSDATGGVIQPYSRRVDVLAGIGGSGTSVDPAETWSLTAHDQVVWDTFLEFPTSAVDNAYTPRFGIFDGSGFPHGTFRYTYNGANGQFNPTPPDGYTDGSWDGLVWRGVATFYGDGPNGGKLWRFVTSCTMPSAISNAQARAFLFQSDATVPPARTIYIHNHVALRLPSYRGRIYGDLPFTVVAAGQTPVLSAERITFPGRVPNGSFILRADLRNRPFNYAYNYVFAPYPHPGSAYTICYFHGGGLRFYPPSVAPFNILVAEILTLASIVPTDRVIQFYRNGVKLTNNTTPIDDFGQFTTFSYGSQETPSGQPLVPVRRIQTFARALSDAEVTQVHDRIVAMEG